MPTFGTDLPAVLLDTSAYSAFRKGNDELIAAVRGAPVVAMNIVVLAELLEGFRRGTRLESNLSDLGAFRTSPRFQLLDLDETTAERYALIVGQLRRAGTPIPTNDVWIAASALQHGCTVLTTDRHFLDVPSVSVRHFPAAETGSERS